MSKVSHEDGQDIYVILEYSGETVRVQLPDGRVLTVFADGVMYGKTPNGGTWHSQMKR